jgi:hypothetical protein
MEHNDATDNVYQPKMRVPLLNKATIAYPRTRNPDMDAGISDIALEKLNCVCMCIIFKYCLT